MTETKTSPHASSDLLHPINPAGEPAASGETWVAVADLHGHLGHFEALLAFLDRELGADYRLCTLGDYVDNGREIPALLDRLIALQQTRGERFVPIIGNHDLALLRALGWPGSLANPLWMQRWKERYWNRGLGTPEVYARLTGVAKPLSAAGFAAVLPPKQRAFLEGLPWLHDTGEFLFVHAGMEAGPLAPQCQALAAKQLPADPLDLPPQLRGRTTSTVADPDWDRLVVSAHNRHLGGPWFEGPNRICLSGEVDSSGKLYAVVLPGRRYLEVDQKLQVSDVTTLLPPPGPGIANRSSPATAVRQAPSVGKGLR